MKHTHENEYIWDTVADCFTEASALPVWGPFGVGADINLIPEIKGKTFLEVGCGSGRSIHYLMNNGATKVYGLDASSVQLAEAAHLNAQAISTGSVELIKGYMEDTLDIEPVDIVFSVYALGWTSDPKTTLEHIYTYLKPGGFFVWSWDHALFANTRYINGEFVVDYSYHEEKPIEIKNWMKEGITVTFTYLKSETWFRLLKDAGFEIIGYHEPEPKNLHWGSEDPNEYYSLQKAQKVPATCIFVCRKKP